MQGVSILYIGHRCTRQRSRSATNFLFSDNIGGGIGQLAGTDEIIMKSYPVGIFTNKVKMHL